MAKSELFDDHGKLFAWLLKSVGTFPVARGSADKSAVLHSGAFYSWWQCCADTRSV